MTPQRAKTVTITENFPGSEKWLGAICRNPWPRLALGAPRQNFARCGDLQEILLSFLNLDRQLLGYRIVRTMERNRPKRLQNYAERPTAR